MIVDRAITPPLATQRVIDPERLVEMQRRVDEVYVDPALIEYAVRLAGATREPDVVGLGDLARYISFGASPRASISLILAARALAFVRGRDYALPPDVTDLALDVLRHRLVLSYEAMSDEITADQLAAAGDGRPARARRRPAGPLMARTRRNSSCAAWSGR